MIGELTSSERLMALIVSGVVSFFGLLLAAAGTGGLLESQGWIIMIYGLVCLFYVLGGMYEPEPPESRLSSYYDTPTKAAIFLSMSWAIFGMFMGVWIAALLAYPEWTFDAAWATFGRLRPRFGPSSTAAGSSVRFPSA